MHVLLCLFFDFRRSICNVMLETSEYIRSSGLNLNIWRESKLDCGGKVVKGRDELTVTVKYVVLTCRGRFTLSLCGAFSTQEWQQAVEGPEQLNLSALPWPDVTQSLCVCVCVCTFGSNSERMVGTCPLSFFTVATLLDDTHTIRFRCACCWHAGQRGGGGLAVPDTEEGQGGRPAPRGSADHWGGGLCLCVLSMSALWLCKWGCQLLHL